VAVELLGFRETPGRRAHSRQALGKYALLPARQTAAMACLYLYILLQDCSICQNLLKLLKSGWIREIATTQALGSLLALTNKLIIVIRTTTHFSSTSRAWSVVTLQLKSIFQEKYSTSHSGALSQLRGIARLR